MTEEHKDHVISELRRLGRLPLLDTSPAIAAKTGRVALRRRLADVLVREGVARYADNDARTIEYAGQPDADADSRQ